MSFQGQRILITGGSRGIGFGVAKAFLDVGARVALNGRTAESVAAAIGRLGNNPRLVAAPGDVGTVAGCEGLVRAAITGLGGLDVLVNNAGVGFGRSIEDGDEAVWHAIVDVNLKGTYFCARAALPALRAARGNIVNVASDAGLMGSDGLAIYCASKGGVVNMTRAMALELAPDVRVNCVCPGYIDTDMVRRDDIDKAMDPKARERQVIDYAPLKRIGTAEDVAGAILFLAGSTGRFVTGAALQIDGGSTAGLSQNVTGVPQIQL